MSIIPITVVETPQFLRQSNGLWTDDEGGDFIDFIARNPESGDIIPETGGVRKVRWKRRGGGKRGGVRVVYFYYNAHHPLFLLMIYAKAMRENVSPDAKKVLAEFSARFKRAARS